MGIKVRTLTLKLSSNLTQSYENGKPTRHVGQKAQLDFQLRVFFQVVFHNYPKMFNSNLSIVFKRYDEMEKPCTEYVMTGNIMQIRFILLLNV